MSRRFVLRSKFPNSPILKFLNSLLLPFFSFFIFSASAQETPNVSAKFDRDSIMIGDRFQLEVRVEKDMMQMVEFPFLTGGEMSENVEVVGEFPEDTVAQDGRRQTLSKRYVMTIFAEGDYNLGTFPVLYADKNIVDTLMSADSLRMRVATFDIDLEKDKPFDIKPPMGIPLKFGEIGGWFALTVGILAVLILGIWFAIKYRKYIPFLAPKPVVPPHIVAIRQLEALRNQKLPQNNRHKQYYSAITDILREYIKGRFGIQAMEMTSAEILDAVDAPRRDGLVDDKRYTDLRDTLQTADLVKFAKWVPEEEQNEAAWYNAYYFIEETKPADIDGKPVEAEEDPLKYNEK
jgi:hypothetical protein